VVLKQKANRVQPLLQTVRPFVIGIAQCAVDIETHSPDARDLEWHA